jgi:hypothetical protein
MQNNDLREEIYPSWDKQYFDKNWDLVKTVFRDWVIIDFSWIRKKVTQERKYIPPIDIDDIPF